ncbi:MAG: rRNA maturation RNase YbeY [bacterium]
MKKSEEIRLRCLSIDILEFLKVKNVGVGVYVINDNKMIELNKQFRGKNETTTVLSFEAPVGFPHIPFQKKQIGEIFLSADCIAKRDEPIEYFLAHGILHLLGFSHDKKSDRIEMGKEEDKVLLWLKSKY